MADKETHPATTIHSDDIPFDNRIPHYLRQISKFCISLLFILQFSGMLQQLRAVFRKAEMRLIAPSTHPRSGIPPEVGHNSGILTQFKERWLLHHPSNLKEIEFTFIDVSQIVSFRKSDAC